MNIKRYIKNPALLVPALGRRGWFNWMSDEAYLKLVYKINFGVYPDLENPKMYNEKLQWLKLHDRKPEYTQLADKYLVREHVAESIGEEHLIPLLWAGESFDEIDFETLPQRFVIKCSHDSGSVVVCRDKASFDVKKARKKINKHLKTNLYWAFREWVYKDIQPKIIIEEYIGEENELPDDYKFMVFDGEIDSVFVCRDRKQGHAKYYYYDLNWNRLDYQSVEPEAEQEPQKPENFDKMVEIVKQLSKGFYHIRVDLYNVHGEIYFGELTFYNDAGFDVDINEKTNALWGRKIKLPVDKY